MEEYNQSRSVQNLLPIIQHLLPSEKTEPDKVVILSRHENWSEFRESFIDAYYEGPYAAQFDPSDASRRDDFIYGMDESADLYLSLLDCISGEPHEWLSSRAIYFSVVMLHSMHFKNVMADMFEYNSPL